MSEPNAPSRPTVEQLARYLDLSRYLASPDTARVPRSELMRLRQAAPAQARALLETEGHFNAQVSTQARDDGQVVALTLRVDPGPVARVTYYGATWLRGRCSECP